MERKTSPERINTDMYEKLLHELKERGSFCLWKYEERDGRMTKVSYQTRGLRADSTNKATFTDYAIECRDHPLLCGEDRGSAAGKGSRYTDEKTDDSYLLELHWGS